MIAEARKQVCKQVGDLCPKCERTDVEFTKGKCWCRSCRTTATRERRQRNPEKRRAYRQAVYQATKRSDPTGLFLKSRDKDMRWRYGVSLNDLERVVTEQNGCCPICTEPLGAELRQRRVDHDHSVKDKRAAVRGVTCNNCNLLLGHARDNSAILKSAIDYLERAAVRRLLGGGAVDCLVRDGRTMAFIIEILSGDVVSAQEPIGEPMTAAVEMPDRLCVVYWVRRQGLSVKIRTYCGVEVEAGRGVVQVPDQVVQGAPWMSASGDVNAKRVLRICEQCKIAVRG